MKRRRKLQAALSETQGDESDSSIVSTVHLVSHFLSLQDILNLRLASKVILAELHDHSGPDVCSIWLSQYLKRRNIFAFQENWLNASNEDYSLEQYLERSRPRDRGGDSSSFSFLDLILRHLNVSRYIPREAAVCYDGKYGRHVLPCRATENNGVGEFFRYAKCHRGKENCITCRQKIPVTASDAAEKSRLDEVFSITKMNKDNETQGMLDLNHFYNTCVPNLPPDLACPVCRNRDHRTLLLSVWSYQSEQGTERSEPVEMKLSFTPHDDTEQSKRPRFDHSNKKPTLSAFPFQYRDMFLPIPHIPLAHTEDCKHAISINCVHCKRFGLLSPVGLCCQSEFSCLHRGTNLHANDKATRSTQCVIGGIVTRESCSQIGCPNPVLCFSCSANSSHQTAKQLSCKRCSKRYCWNHEPLAVTCCSTKRTL